MEKKYITENKPDMHMTAESGRSMVEMLGVLAIIGVISIGAVSGYNYGMNRYRTNEVLDGGNKRAYTISTQDSLGIPYNLSEFKDSDVTGGGTFASTVQDWDGEFGLTVTKVTKPVCENLIRMIGDRTTLRAITTTADKTTDLNIGDCADGENSLYLVYNKDMLAADNENSSRQDSPSGVSSTGGSASASSSIAVATSYCDTHTCNLTCKDGDGNEFSCGTDNQSRTYDEAEAYCAAQGGTLVTASELGCTTLYERCTGTVPSGEYWVAGNVDVDQIASHEGYSSAEAFLSAYGFSSASEFASAFVPLVYGGKLGYDSSGNYSPPLCK